MAFEDKAHALSGSSTCTFHADAIAASEEFRKNYESRLNVVKAVDMPWERSPDGLIKHLVHHKMNTRERCVLKRLAEGLTRAQIAHIERLSLRTVERTTADLMTKLAAPSPFVLGMKAAQTGLVPPMAETTAIAPIEQRRGAGVAERRHAGYCPRGSRPGSAAAQSGS